MPGADTVTADATTVARARRHGPLPWSALGPGPILPLPAGMATWLADEVDRAWGELGHPDPLVVVEQGGRLAADVLAAGPVCAPALRWLLVAPGPVAPGLAAPTGRGAGGPGAARLGDGIALEDPALVLGPALAAEDPDEAPAPEPGTGPAAAVVGDLPTGLAVAVVVAVGEVDRLPADRFEWRGGRWWELRLAASASGGLREMAVEAPASWAGVAPTPWPVRVTGAAQRWLVQARGVARAGRVLVVDDPTAGPPPLAALRPAPRRVEALPGHLSPLIASTWTMSGR